jgi:hypothetical protein
MLLLNKKLVKAIAARSIEFSTTKSIPSVDVSSFKKQQFYDPSVQIEQIDDDSIVTDQNLETEDAPVYEIKDHATELYGDRYGLIAKTIRDAQKTAVLEKK